MYLLVTGFYAFLSHLDYLYAAVAAYLCGCFNGALFTSRLFFHDAARHRLRYAQGGRGGEPCGMARRAL